MFKQHPRPPAVARRTEDENVRHEVPNLVPETAQLQEYTDDDDCGHE
jgi:hypothetical protein